MSLVEIVRSHPVRSALLGGALLSVLAVSGCSPDVKPDRDAPENPIPSPVFAGKEAYTGVPWEKILKSNEDYLADEDVKFGSKEDAENVAHWVKERRDAIKWCLEQKTNLGGTGNDMVVYKQVWPDDTKRPETRLDQAIAIMSRVLDSVPSDTPERYTLGKALFIKGSAEFWNLDAAVHKRGEDQLAKKPEDPKLTEVIEKHRKAMIAYHLASRREFEKLMGEMTMWKAGAFYMWSIEFQLGNFKKSLAWINKILEMPDLDADARKNFEFYRSEINTYLANVEIDRATPKPLSEDRDKRRVTAPRDGMGNERGAGD
ncbi:hypothetical protein HY251_12600 [bacterium]|nr:hypothetical protein [bacterium]